MLAWLKSGWSWVKSTVSAIGNIGKIDQEVQKKKLELQAATEKSRADKLEEKLKIREELIARDNCYWTKEGDGPFCTRCADVDGMKVRLTKLQSNCYACQHCKGHYSTDA